MNSVIIAINDLKQDGRYDLIEKLKNNQIGRKHPDQYSKDDLEIIEHIKKITHESN